MLKPKVRTFDSPERGGITILVALFLLILLTVSAVGLSRNTLREAIITGTVRQGMAVRNTADAGLSWAVYWLDETNAATGSTAAYDLQTQVNTLLVHPENSGKWQSVAANSTDTYLVNTSASKVYWDAQVMRMNKLITPYVSYNAVPANSGAENLYPDFWALRVNSHFTQGPVDFVHHKEAWISTKTRTVTQ